MGLRNKDFRYKTIEGTPARYACLKRGECDAVPLGQPQEGYQMLGISTEAVPEFLYTVTAARRSWAAANKDAVARYARALGAALKFIRDRAIGPPSSRSSSKPSMLRRKSPNKLSICSSSPSAMFCRD